MFSALRLHDVPTSRLNTFTISRFKFLQALKTQGLTRGIPNISQSTAQMIHFFVTMKKARSVLEIGSANGYSTIWLGDAVEAVNGKVLSLEIGEHSYKEALANIAEAGLSATIELQLCDALEFLKDHKTQYDVIFLDARKGYYHLFWELIKPRMHSETLVIVDDVIKFKSKTQAFDDAIKKETDFDFCVIPVDGDDGVMLIMPKAIRGS